MHEGEKKKDRRNINVKQGCILTLKQITQKWGAHHSWLVLECK